MAASRSSGGTAVAAALRSFVQQVVSEELDKGSHRSSLVRELRQVSHALAKLERRVESMSERMPGRSSAKKRPTRGPGRPPTHERCTVSGCREHHYARGLCSRHYQQQRRAERQKRRR